MDGSSVLERRHGPCRSGSLYLTGLGVLGEFIVSVLFVIDTYVSVIIS